MAQAGRTYATLDDWIAREAIAFDIHSRGSFNAAVDRMLAALGESAALLGLGEPTHGAAEFLVLRNRLFHRLVEAHGYTAIAIESSFPRARIADDFIAGSGGGGQGGAGVAIGRVLETGFSHGFGRHDANRELVEWMRRHNADASHAVRLRFYGFDSPTEMTGTDSPRQLLHFALDYLASVETPAAQERRRRRIDLLIGDAAAWENPAAMMDPTKSVGSSSEAGSLRVETEELISELHVRRPELIARSGPDLYGEALRHAIGARELLNYHAALARQSRDRIAECLGIRDATMADNLAYAVERERGRGGKVLAFAHNSHLKRGQAQWQLGPHALTWWAAGSHLHHMLGDRYAVIGTGVGASGAMGLGEPEPGTLEAYLSATPGPARFVPTRRGQGLPAPVVAALATRSANPAYFPFTPQSITDFDWLALV
jgi:erythromycin esterase-like protein